jgi:hypothetical protein
VEPSGGSVEEVVLVTGLQPGTKYAYRITIKSGYGNAVGAPATFTTAGLPEVLMSPTPLAMLPVPSIVFPTKPKPAVKCKRGYKRDKHGKCVKTRHRHLLGQTPSKYQHHRQDHRHLSASS